MKLNRGLRMAMEGLLVAMLVVAAGSGHGAAAQTKAPATTAPKAVPKKAPVRRAARPRVQTAPTRARIVEIQEALAREGFYAGKPSGRWDAKTSQAMRNFQTSQGLTATGKLGAQSLQKLGLGSEVAGLAAPLSLADTRPSAMSESELDEPEPQEP
jgi:peptidoglycan hydrolase-like protein with peptidoglycan-binding domain